MQKNRTSVLSIVVFFVVCAFLVLICMSIFKTLGTELGLISIPGALFIAAWMIEMIVPEEILVKLIFILLGLGWMGGTMMSALFPGIFILLLMFGLTALMMAQLLLGALAPPEDG